MGSAIKACGLSSDHGSNVDNIDIQNAALDDHGEDQT